MGLQVHLQERQRPPPQALHRLQARHRPQVRRRLGLQVIRQLVLRHQLGLLWTLVCFDTTSRQRQRLRWQPG